MRDEQDKWKQKVILGEWKINVLPFNYTDFYRIVIITIVCEVTCIISKTGLSKIGVTNTELYFKKYLLATKISDADEVTLKKNDQTMEVRHEPILPHFSGGKNDGYRLWPVWVITTLEVYELKPP